LWSVISVVLAQTTANRSFAFVDGFQTATTFRYAILHALSNVSFLGKSLTMGFSFVFPCKLQFLDKYFFPLLCSSVSRLFVLILFAATCGPWIFLFAVVHVALKTSLHEVFDLTSRHWKEVFAVVADGCLSIFTYMYVIPNKGWGFRCLNYLIYFVENAALLSCFWALAAHSESYALKFWCVFACVISFSLFILASQLLFYWLKQKIAKASGSNT
jgi:hypothetical protein